MKKETKMEKCSRCKENVKNQERKWLNTKTYCERCFHFLKWKEKEKREYERKKDKHKKYGK